MKKILKRYANQSHRKILFTDENMFSVEEHSNCQVVKKSSIQLPLKVWWGVANDIFAKKRVKTSVKVFQQC